jgi:uncharacterized caspase-like protein
MKGLLAVVALWFFCTSTVAAERVALVIGNNAYRPVPQGRGVPPLNNARNDARAVAAKLRSDPLGFEVIEAYDLTQEQMAERLAEFGQRLTATGRIGFFYYAGHGAQLRLGVGSEARDENLLMGVDVDVSTTVRLERGSLKLSEVLSSMRGAGRPVNVVVLDACRDNPASDSRGNRGLAEVGGAGSGFLIQYATAANRTASDGPPGSNGAYTRELLSWLDRPGLSLGDVFTEVAGAVKRGTGQEPWMSSTIGERVFLAGSAASAPASAPAVATPDAETVFWQSTEALGNEAAYRAYLEWYPGGQFAALAQLKLAPVVPSPAVAPAPALAPATGEGDSLPSRHGGKGGGMGVHRQPA